MNKTSIAIFILTTIIFSNLWAQKKATVAVLDFEGRNISQVEAATLTDRLISELGNTEAVTLVERRQLERILEEQGLQQSGCTSDDCVAEVGQLLGVQYMVSGSINKLGNTYTIDAKMFSVETGANIKTVSRTLRGRIDELVPLMEAIAWELVGLDERKQETVAVLDFEGRGISQMEAATLTDRFTTALGNTEAVLLVARQEMKEILQEQGFGQQSCTSVECAAEVGALIGVKNIVNGSVGKIGETYTIDAQMINVATGATVKTVSQTYTGRIDGLITEIEIMAWEIVNLKPPQALLQRQRSGSPTSMARAKTRGGAIGRSLVVPGWGQLYQGRKFSGYTYLTTELILGGLAIVSNGSYSTAKSDYDKYHDLYVNEDDYATMIAYKRQAEDYYDQLQDYRNQTIMFGGAAAAVWVLNTIHAAMIKPDALATKKATIEVVYDKQISQTRLRWSYALD